jgi:hypothetical protein
LSQPRYADADHVRREKSADGASDDDSDSAGDLTDEEEAEGPLLNSTDVT